MMSYREQAVSFPVAGDLALGIAALPELTAELTELPGDCGVLIAVGGPQYRVGSHRQFLLLSRRLAAEGFPVFRFDYRGMGDSDGAMRSFENVSEDIAAAVDTFRQTCPGIRRVVLWGLCDAASAILMYLHATRDSRIDGVVLLNPWVRSEASLAQTHIKHYYGQRLLQREFWMKLFSGKMRVFHSLRELLSTARKARQSSGNKAEHFSSFQDRMADGLRRFKGDVLLILSGDDYTAREFLEYSTAHPMWSELIQAANVCRLDVQGADHTFSTQELRTRVEDETLRWLRSRHARPLQE